MPENFEKRTYADRAEKLRSYAARRRRVAQVIAVRYKGRSCKRCGYNKSPAAMEFHHRESVTKKFTVSTRAFNMPWPKVRAELDKCDLVCANCHREIHDEMLYTGGAK